MVLRCLLSENAALHSLGLFEEFVSCFPNSILIISLRVWLVDSFVWVPVLHLLILCLHSVEVHEDTLFLSLLYTAPVKDLPSVETGWEAGTLIGLVVVEVGIEVLDFTFTFFGDLAVLHAVGEDDTLGSLFVHLALSLFIGSDSNGRNSPHGFIWSWDTEDSIAFKDLVLIAHVFLIRDNIKLINKNI